MMSYLWASHWVILWPHLWILLTCPPISQRQSLHVIMLMCNINNDNDYASLECALGEYRIVSLSSRNSLHLCSFEHLSLFIHNKKVRNEVFPLHRLHIIVSVYIIYKDSWLPKSSLHLISLSPNFLFSSRLIPTKHAFRLKFSSLPVCLFSWQEDRDGPHRESAYTWLSRYKSSSAQSPVHLKCSTTCSS